ncbi:MAG: peptidase [SAR86 cluster bacterium]|uniref:Peptidase n=1 Tax=SAR86 cluster bacterium TaxID=2030880 RepID=A0A2A5CGS1_9GAMM|nr:peptidase [Gammaproteobacteria bacterium AH-315-E17]PCJ42943.1 MAG: peptidase [SAR86 cluster bacterium]
MTYCVAISVDAGIVFCSDSRTNAGVDQISTYSKMFNFNAAPDRQFVLLSSGNLATSQSTLAQLQSDIGKNTPINLNTVSTIGEAADYIGEVYRRQLEKHDGSNLEFESTFLLGGQIQGSQHRVVKIYSAGNHITSSKDTPYLQIGESKYGTPILDRIISLDTSLETAALCALVSMDSTMRSNLTVGPPVEILLYKANSFITSNYNRFDEDSEYLRELKKNWDQKLKEAFNLLPPLAWAASWEKVAGNNSGTF